MLRIFSGEKSVTTRERCPINSDVARSAPLISFSLVYSIQRTSLWVSTSVTKTRGSLTLLINSIYALIVVDDISPSARITYLQFNKRKRKFSSTAIRIDSLLNVEAVNKSCIILSASSMNNVSNCFDLILCSNINLDNELMQIDRPPFFN